MRGLYSVMVMHYAFYAYGFRFKSHLAYFSFFFFFQLSFYFFLYFFQDYILRLRISVLG